MMQLLLERGGHDVLAVADAESALAAHEADPFDLIVVDWLLPGMSGLELCRTMRALPRGEDLVILVVTGRREPGDLDAVFEAGASDYLPKPVDADQLRVRLMVAERQVREAQRRREAETRLQTVTANIPGVVYQVITDPEGRTEVTYLSEGYRKLLGLAEGSNGAADLLAPLLRSATDPDFVGGELRLEGRPTPRVIDRRTLRSDGSEVWLQVHSKPTPLPDGSTRWDGVAVDITEQKRAEEALRRSEGTFRTLIENAPEAIVVQRDDRLLYANPTFVRLLGYDRAEEVPPESVLALYHPDDVDGVRRAREQIARTGGPSAPMELRLRRPDGSLVTTEAVGMRISYDGAPAVLAILRDVTERNAMRARLMVADRMASVGTLAAGVAHELNNPLAYVLSNVRLLGEELEAVTARLPASRARPLHELVDECADGLERMRAIVRDLKTFARVDDEQHQEIVEIEPVIDACLSMCRNEIRHRARLEKEYGTAPPVRINESRLAQVVLNLVINAAHALPDGRVSANRIIVRTGERDGCAFLEVQDTGAGIAEEDQGRIFDPFFTTKGQGQGTGLGLSICRNIVSAAGGDIAVQSGPGRGTLFRVRLPAAERPADPEVALPLPSRDARGNGTRRLLVVDDEPLVGRALRRMLRDYDVKVVSSGREAVDVLTRDGGYNLILCDLMMPEVSGMEVYEAVAEHHPELADRFVFMTGGAFTPAARQFLDRVQNERIEKPFDPHRVRALVQHCAS